MSPKRYLALDVGEKRIGLATGDNVMKIAIPYGAIEAGISTLETLSRIIKDEQIDALVIGYPRNQQGTTTLQTQYVEKIAEQLEQLGIDRVFQDESLTSVIAEERLRARGKAYTKSDIDIEAATLILQDYLDLR